MSLRDVSKSCGVPLAAVSGVVVSSVLLGWWGSSELGTIRQSVSAAVVAVQESQRNSVAEIKGAHKDIQHEVSLLRVDVQALSRLVDGGVSAAQFSAWVRELRARMRAVPGIGADLEAAVPVVPGK